MLDSREYAFDMVACVEQLPKQPLIEILNALAKFNSSLTLLAQFIEIYDLPSLLTVHLGYGMKFTMKVDLAIGAQFDSDLFPEMVRDQQTLVDLDSMIEQLFPEE